MKEKNKVNEGNSVRATPSLRYLRKTDEGVEIIINKGYFVNVCQNNLPEVFPNSK